MKKIEKVHFSEGSIGKSGSGDNCVLEEPSQVELLLEQIADIAELIDGLRLETKNQDLAIIAKDQHINNLNKAINAKDQHIANLEGFIRNLTKEIAQIKKYSVFYNLLLRFRRELLMWLGKIQK